MSLFRIYCLYMQVSRRKTTPFSAAVLALTFSLFCGLSGYVNAGEIPVLGSPDNKSGQKRYIGHDTNITDYKQLKYISAKSAIIIDAKNGLVLYAKDPDAPRQPASTLKVLTGVLALERLTPDTIVPISKKAARQPRSKLYLDRKKQYRADDLIHGLLLGSANDASVALAEKISGTEQAFALDMTRKAHLWGANNTICQTASGLTAKGQQSTARDLAIIFKHAMQQPGFATILSKNKIKTSYGQTVITHNKALWQVDGAVAGKTGFTNIARQTYVGQFKKDGADIIIALMGSETMWQDVKNLVQFGIAKKLALDKETLDVDSPIASFNLMPMAIEGQFKEIH